MRIALLLALALAPVAFGCGSLPQDHVLRERLDESSARVRHGLDPRRWVEPEVERVAHLRQTVTALLPWEGAERQRLGHLRDATAALAAREVARPAHATRTAVELAAHERDAVAALTRADGALRTELDPVAAARRVRHAAANVPVLLGCERDIRAADPERYDDQGAPRRETFVEWFLRRVWV